MGGVADVMKVAAIVGRRLEKRTSGFFFFFSSIKMCQRAFDLDLTLMSPMGTLEHCTPQVDMGV